ncbi:fluoride efflux transporter CrcB [Leptospira sarikeiensis]|uniref:Fluoride-specific ion channel FluC n=1 Tax=Leptospira sarikeiensis TaxID=2484943 RepID=A0A4R9K3E7_9LEPT|nr:fluoride efflux transporter CrcB [Leptospira sarikeiensis]TGL60580.1 fluoride efflux transporter CrcB [Leptospira sarikeiensis]
MNFILVGLGGFLGSICRYLISQIIQNKSGSFPISTFLVNVGGSLLIGVFYGISQDKFSEEVRLFATVGFCGGFTTFSTFALENLRLFQAGNYIIFLVYTVFSVSVCISAVFLGAYLTK